MHMSDPAETPPATDAAAPQPDAAEAVPSTPEERIAALEAEVAQLRDRWLRAEAENQNQRARAERQVADARNYAIQKFARDVVEAAENLRRGLDALPPPAPDENELLTKLRGGFEGVERSFLALLERNGISRRDVQGETFDPEFHQAMAEQPATGGAAPGTVLQAWTPAWTLNGRLLKPAMVVVAASAGADQKDNAA
jgi:molecular chaperone GrpE